MGSNEGAVTTKEGAALLSDNPEQYRNNHVFPSVSASAATLLLERGVAAIGIDTLSPDRPEDGFKVHHVFLGAGKILIENVANLDNMPCVGAYAMVLPINLEKAVKN